ncbi:glycosyltransferase family 2 protein [Hyphobacterium sp. HN65]|uniref:Glycosyltransferase family 2 protein n=1 Tax=Hyphobacterium lacteum TaxID=3116575 RepID=A0ABU7LME8_9PROT|nr:glycosyltransferase family 2 protein [Hyphobacterium sp. HN65]MEE2525101.1 glycosyltransferase family 2 protein [Hyphobacterium sp. HN65]
MSEYADFANPAALDLSHAQLSVLVPFYRDDPMPLAKALAAGAETSGLPVEILLFDDGEPDPELNAAVNVGIRDFTVATRLLTSRRNVGRAAGRNRLASAAIGDWLLFLDADMTIGPDFLRGWLDLISQYEFDAAFGGYTADPVTRGDHRLHAALARSSDENTADRRNRIGATAFCTSNLLVKADLMRSTPFDEHFTGWGWEDVDWAVRADQRGELVHFDHPAGHSGWQTPDILLRKFKDAAVNYARLLEKHPQLAQLPGAKAARFLKAVPGQALLRGVWALMAQSPVAPMKARTTALKLWRASWAAEAIHS